MPSGEGVPARLVLPPLLLPFLIFPLLNTLCCGREVLHVGVFTKDTLEWQEHMLVSLPLHNNVLGSSVATVSPGGDYVAIPEGG